MGKTPTIRTPEKLAECFVELAKKDSDVTKINNLKVTLEIDLANLDSVKSDIQKAVKFT